MADEDIDIEEHDVLDNPVIRRIFPDISIIKQEILQYYEEVPHIKPDPEASTKYESKSKDEIVLTNAAKDVRNDYRNPPIKPLVDIVDVSYFDKKQKKTELRQSNKIILGTKPSNSKLTVAVDEKKDNTIGHTNEQRSFDSTIRVPKVVLQDLGAYIYQSNRYCKECVTLFASRLDFDNHKHKVHSTIRRKTPLNVAENNVLEKSKSEPHKNKCKICKTHFSTSASLIRHCKNIHKEIGVKPKNDSSLKHTNKLSGITQEKISNPVNSDMQLNKSSLEKNRNKCSICTSTFSNVSNLSRHYKNVHQKNVTFKSNRQYKKTVTYKRNISHVVKMNKKTRSSKKIVVSKNSNVCFHCKKPFPDSKSLIDHIYEVLEPKRLSKHQLRKKVSQKATLREDLINCKTGRIQNAFPGKSLRDKLIYENQDSDCSDHFDTEDNNGNEDLVTNTSQNKKENVSATKKVNAICDNQVSNDSSSDHFDTEESNKNKNLKTNVPKKDKKRNLSQQAESSNTNKSKEKELSTKKSSSDKQHKQGHSKIKFGQNYIQSSKNNWKKAMVTKNNTGHQNNSKSLKRKRNDENNHSSPDRKKHTSQAVQSKNKDSPTPNCMNKENKIQGEMVYECVYCSYMLPSSRAYCNHVRSKHRVDEISLVNKVMFYDQCKYCPSKSRNVSAHNHHLYVYHFDLIYKQFPNEIIKQKVTKLKNPMFRKFQSFVLESIIYKCTKCDVHFSSSCIAKDHEKHMELLINWKCSICGRIFKKHDKYLHLKQHDFSKTLNVCQFTESELDRLLYNCTKCAIHFKEDRYLEHFSKCNEQPTDSVYCKKCDILIDKCGYENHESYHKLGEHVTDFTFVAADIIDVSKNKEVVVEKKRKRLYQQVNCYTFCPTCKCYLTDIALSRKAHIEAQCSQIPKHICELCGLILTNVSLKVHRGRHRKNKDLNLKSFKFFDLKGNQINPPVPEYPSCTNCDVYFVSKNAVKSHKCVETDIFNCDICNIKLSENAFKLHMQFHNYCMLTPNKDTLQATSVIEKETSEAISPEIRDQHIVPDVPNVNKIIKRNSSTEIQHDPVDLISTDHSRSDIIIYSCQSCKVAVDSYNKVVEHCQNHFSTTPKSFTESKMCPKCSMHIESGGYEKHQQFHSSCETIQCYTFDPVYFTCDNDTWIQHVFAPATTSVRQKILRESIYQHECRIKMDIVQKGPLHLTVYKCDKCGNFIDPDCLFAHAKDCCRKSIRIHPCSMCGLPFMSNSFRSKHEKIHRRYNSICIKSYNMVLINREAHSIYTNNIIKAVNQYVLYQCRTCYGVVDKLQRDVHQCSVDALRKCSICKLLVNRSYYDSHVSKHKHYDKIKTSNIKLILFGNKDESNLKKIVTPNFCGIICDYTLYKCAKCKICVNDDILISNHICSFDDSKSQCHICGFYIAPESLKQHMDMHDADLEFQTENIRTISFDSSKCDDNNSDQTVKETSSLPFCENYNEKELESDAADIITPPSESKGTKTTANNVSDDINIEIKGNACISVQLFRCTCGLHYKDVSNAKTCCSVKMKVVRQACTKCSLVFNPKELFSHLIAHHGNKNKIYKYDVIEISPENVSDVKEP